MKTLFIAFVCLLVSVANADSDSKEFAAKGLKTLKLDNTSGNVNIEVSKDDKAYVTANKVKFEKGCELTMDRSGSELEVEVDQKKGGLFSSPTCKVNFEIKLPKVIALRLKSGSGDFKIIGTKGKVNIKVGSGNTKIEAEVDKLEGRSGSGDFVVKGLTGNVDVKTGSGDVTLSYKTAVKKGEVEIKTGSGDATLFFPSAMTILTDFKAGSGKVYNELGDNSDASFKVSMRAGSGDLKIKKIK